MKKKVAATIKDFTPDLFGEGILKKFESKYVITAAGCWEWQGKLSKFGYGNFYIRGKTFRAHRYSYSAFVEPVPSDLVVDHLCKNKCCVNPSHLESVTQYENIIRGNSVVVQYIGTDKCINGHVYTPDNTAMRKDTKFNVRKCLTCRRDYSREYQRRHAESRKAKRRAKRSVILITLL
jgi:hypothetical protein